jgi:uncharacterized protein YcbX
VKVVELWRYPVKSLQGELLDQATVTATGLAGDRAFAIFDVDTGLGLTARRVPELLYGRAHATRSGAVEIELPDGTLAQDDGALSRWLGRPVTLRSVSTGGARVYENPLDFENEATSEWMRFEGSAGAFHDSARTQVSIVSTGTIGDWDRRRFRANVLVDGSGEDDLVGARVRVGDAVFEIVQQIPRCVMTTRPQPDGIERDLAVLRLINNERGGYLAVAALVVQPGVVRVGDELTPSG